MIVFRLTFFFTMSRMLCTTTFMFNSFGFDSHEYCTTFILKKFFNTLSFVILCTSQYFSTNYILYTKLYMAYSNYNRCTYFRPTSSFAVRKEVDEFFKLTENPNSEDYFYVSFSIFALLELHSTLNKLVPREVSRCLIRNSQDLYFISRDQRDKTLLALIPAKTSNKRIN